MEGNLPIGKRGKILKEEGEGRRRLGGREEKEEAAGTACCGCVKERNKETE